MYNLIVTEKPSVARTISKVLSVTARHDGYLEGGGYLISWCVGHLVELAPPGVYDPRLERWDRADLPILPERWQYLVSSSTKKQFDVLCKLMHRADVDRIICATDAGREGELIFRLVYHQCNCRKPVSRLWISSMEDAAIRAGFAISSPQLNTICCTKQPFAGSVPTGWSASMRPGFFHACTASLSTWAGS